MNLTPAVLLEHARSEAGRRAIRYSTVSLFGVVTTNILLFIMLHALDMKPGWANFVSVSIISIPAFLLNKHWVWGKRGRAHLRREVIPFWAFTVAGWILSTLAVVMIYDWTENKTASQIGNIIGFGILWVLKYLFLDKIMFGPHHHTPYDEDIELEEAVAEAHAAGAAEV